MQADDVGQNGKGALAEVRRIARSFHVLTKGWWSGPTLWQAWFLTFALAASLAILMGVNVLANRWQGWFFDAIGKRDSVAIWQTVAILPVLVFCTAFVGVCIVLSREILQTRWRQWITRRLLDRWLGSNRFQKLKASGKEPANPEYRIADDVRMTIEPLTDLVIGLVSAVLSASAFIGILWSVGGGYNLPAFGTTIYIPAYFVLAALVYGIFTSGLIAVIGRKLIWKVAARNEAEAAFRSTLTLVRDRAEEIAASHRSRIEQEQAFSRYELVVRRWLDVTRTHSHITWITNSNGIMIATVPLLLAAPKYIAGEMSLGDVVRVAGAFAAVQTAISWLVDNFRVVALWAASARRVVELSDAINEIEGAPLQEEHALAPISAVSQAPPGEYTSGELTGR
jgi:putative ATP-binding cassette transporter